MKTNVKAKTSRVKVVTHGGASTYEVGAKEQLRRSVMSCLLWEDQHYEDGTSIAQRIADLIPKVKAVDVAAIAVEARHKMKLRHVPLLIVREMARYESHRGLIAETLVSVIERADELAEFLSIYWKDGKTPISAQIKRGLAEAFKKFDEYALAKYNRDSKVKLKDVLFMVHPKPDNKKQEKLWKKLIENKMEIPDTWETELSAGKDKKKTFERLIKEEKLGAMALLRNLRNMKESGVEPKLIFEALENANLKWVLPFRFITAAKYAPQWESHIEKAMFKSLSQKPKLAGKTILIVDVSGSMYGGTLSAKSELNRAEVACSLAVLVRELCEESAIYATAGNDGSCIHKTKQVPDRHGFALSEAIYKMSSPLGGGGIFLTQVMDYVLAEEKNADRVIVITDEQDCDRGVRSPDKANAFGKHNYIVNVGSYKNGIAYKKKWTHINGWSEAILDYVAVAENEA